MLAVSALFLSVWLGAASSNCSSDATSVLQLRSNDTSEGVSVEAELAVGDVFANYGGGKFCTDRGGNRRRRGNFDHMECDTDWVESWQTFRVEWTSANSPQDGLQGRPREEVLLGLVCVQAEAERTCTRHVQS